MLVRRAHPPIPAACNAALAHWGDVRAADRRGVGVGPGGLRPERREACGPGERAQGTHRLRGQRGEGCAGQLADLRGDEPGPLFYRVRKGGALVSGRVSTTSLKRMLAKRAEEAGIAPFTLARHETDRGGGPTRRGGGHGDSATAPRARRPSRDFALRPEARGGEAAGGGEAARPLQTTRCCTEGARSMPLLSRVTAGRLTNP